MSSIIQSFEQVPLQCRDKVEAVLLTKQGKIRKLVYLVVWEGAGLIAAYKNLNELAKSLNITKTQAYDYARGRTNLREPKRRRTQRLA